MQFTLYEELKKWRIGQKQGRPNSKLVFSAMLWANDLNNAEWIFASTTSKTLALIITYPYQVLRSRLQAHDAKKTYSSARDVIKKTFRSEGIQGFYKGYLLSLMIGTDASLIPSTIRVLPGTIVTFVVYENINRSFESRS